MPFAKNAKATPASLRALAAAFGVGVQYDLPALFVRAEFTRYTDVGDEDDTGESDIDAIGISAGVRF